MTAQDAPQAVTTYLSLGANLGDRRANLERALALLRQTPGVRITAVSSIYRTAPVGVTDQPEFLNLVAQAQTTLEPAQLARVAKRIESRLGRSAGARWGPRPIDIDILLYDEVTLDTGELTLPHPRMSERAFVMVPLAEVAPELRLPDGRRAREVAESLRQEQDVRADI